MDVFARTLVAVDGSSPSEAAVRLALRMAGTERRAIRIVTVLERDTGAMQTEATACPGALAVAVAIARARGTEVEAALRIGRPVDQILEEADAWNATCIVIGTHGRGGPAHVLSAVRRLRSGATRIPCRGRHRGRARLRASSDVRGSARRPLCDRLRARSLRPRRFDRRALQDARRDLKALGATAAVRGVRIAVHVVGGRDVASIIVAGAAQFGCGMVMMGMRGRHGIPAVLGSTAAGVTRGASVPVLVFHERRRVRYTPDVQAAILHAH